LKFKNQDSVSFSFYNIPDELVKSPKWYSVILSEAKNLIRSIRYRSFTSFRMTNNNFLRDHHTLCYPFDSLFEVKYPAAELGGILAYFDKGKIRTFVKRGVTKTMHDDISLIESILPGLTKPAPDLIWGNPVPLWIPAGVYPVLDTGRE
jgi:hypothetical protein